MSHTAQLNGKDLALSTGGDVPTPIGMLAAKGVLTLPAASVTFLTFADANNQACR
jgi:hypothetical protein